MAPGIIQRGAIAGFVWAAYAVASNLYQSQAGQPALLTPAESAIEAGFACLMGWGVLRRSRVAVSLLFLQVAGGGVTAAIMMEQALVALIALPFLYTIGHAALEIFRHHRSEPEAASRVGQFLAFALGGGLVVGFGSLVAFGLSAPPTRVLSAPQIPKRYVSIARELDLVGEDEKVLYFYSPAFFDIRDEMYLLTDRKIVAHGETWVEPTISIPYAQVENLDFQHEPSWMADSYLIVRSLDGVVLVVPLSSEGAGDRRFHERLRESVDPDGTEEPASL